MKSSPEHAKASSSSKPAAHAARTPSPAPFAGVVDRLGNAGLAALLAARAPTGPIQRQCACGGSGDDCACDDKDELSLQRRSTGSPSRNPALASGPPPIVRSILAQSGRPLPDTVHAPMRDHFGADFSAVRLHEGSDASAAATAINARAFTSGVHVVLGRDVQPATDSGRAVLQHELAHVVQQSRGQRPARWIDDGPNDPLERAADHAAHVPARPSSPPTSPATAASHASAHAPLQREERRAVGSPEVFDFGPCEVDVERLYNGELLMQLNRARAFIANNEPCEGECYDYANYYRRLTRERLRRIDRGHLWLAEPGMLTIPDTLYVIAVRGEEQLSVSQIRGSYADTPALEGVTLVSINQFYAFSQEYNLPVIDLEDQPATFFDALHGLIGEVDWTAVLSMDSQKIANSDLASQVNWPFTYPSPFTDPANPTLPVAPPMFLGGVPRADLGWPMDASAGPFPVQLELSSDAADAALSQSPPPATPSSVLLDQLRAAPGKYTPAGPERVFFAPDQADIAPPIDGYVFESLADDESWDPTTMSGPALAPLGRPAVLPEGASGVQWDGSHSSDVVSLHGRNITRGFRAGYARHFWSDMEIWSKYRIGHRATSSLNVGTPGAYTNDALFALGGETVHAVLPKKHWPGMGTVVVYRTDGTPATAAEIIELMGKGQVAMSGEQYRYSPPPEGTRADSNAAAYAEQHGIPWPCGGARMCINLPLNAQGVPDIHTEALGTPMVYADEHGNVIDLRNPNQANAGRMSEYMQLPEEYFTQRGLTRVRMGPAVMRGYGIAGALGGSTSLVMDAFTGNLNDGTGRRAMIGTGGGIVGAVAEDYLATGITTRLAGTGMSGMMASGFGRVGAATGVGAVIAPVATGLEMYFDDRKYTGIDYAARMGRSTVTAVAGAGAGAGAIILTTTLAGSELPIVGNIIGFIVGVGIVLLTDYAIGDDIEQGIRNTLGEKGCEGTIYAWD